nr:M23 family metallopeptidase [Lachnospiraceae bacterium]
MQKNNKKQKKSLIFSTAVVVVGCIATAIYVNQTMESASDYKVDLAQLNTETGESVSISNDPELNRGASLARVSGGDVVNERPKDSGAENKKSIKTEKSSETELQDSEPIEETASDSVVAQTTELSFEPENGIGWPVVGDVILNFSMDSAVYFATLEQYKYNPAILIGADQGNPVSAVAQGQVVKIAKSPELGQYLVMDLGSGYEVTYGQLEELQVSEGDVVARGQVLGYVAKASKYYSVEGNHIYLKIIKDGEPVNPLSLLQ